MCYNHNQVLGGTYIFLFEVLNKNGHSLLEVEGLTLLKQFVGVQSYFSNKY